MERPREGVGPVSVQQCADLIRVLGVICAPQEYINYYCGVPEQMLRYTADKLRSMECSAGPSIIMGLSVEAVRRVGGMTSALTLNYTEGVAGANSNMTKAYKLEWDHQQVYKAVYAARISPLGQKAMVPEEAASSQMAYVLSCDKGMPLLTGDCDYLLSQLEMLRIS